MADTGLARSWRIFEAMRREQDDPVGTYTFMAADLAAMVGSYLPLAGVTAIDVGGGPGYGAEALRAAGAHAFTVDPSYEELHLHGRTPQGAVVGDGMALPVADGAVDVVCTLNALEHVADPWAFLRELVRVVRPGGIVFVGVTNWLSPWGGHETSPWHYLGGRRARERYARRHGHEPKNRYGESLFPVTVRAALDWAGRLDAGEVLDVFPRYHPRWAWGLVKVPGLRELGTWNLVLVVRRR